MKIELKNIKIKDLYDEFRTWPDSSVKGYHGHLYPDNCEDEYAYSDEDIKSITKDFKFYKEDE